MGVYSTTGQPSIQGAGDGYLAGGRTWECDRRRLLLALRVEQGDVKTSHMGTRTTGSEMRKASKKALIMASLSLLEQDYWLNQRN